MIDDAIASAVFVTRCSAHSQLNYQSTGGVVFNRDVLLDIPFHADLQMLQHHQQKLVDERSLRQNAKRKHFDFQPGQSAMASTNCNGELQPVWEGPHNIEMVHTDGAVTVGCSPEMTDRVNIRKIKLHES